MLDSWYCGTTPKTDVLYKVHMGGQIVSNDSPNRWAAESSTEQKSSLQIYAARRLVMDTLIDQTTNASTLPYNSTLVLETNIQPRYRHKDGPLRYKEL